VRSHARRRSGLLRAAVLRGRPGTSYRQSKGNHGPIGLLRIGKWSENICVNLRTSLCLSALNSFARANVSD
jgi:hypothetical protein